MLVEVNNFDELNQSTSDQLELCHRSQRLHIVPECKGTSVGDLGPGGCRPDRNTHVDPVEDAEDQQ